DAFILLENFAKGWVKVGEVFPLGEVFRARIACCGRYSRHTHPIIGGFVARFSDFDCILARAGLSSFSQFSVSKPVTEPRMDGLYGAWFAAILLVLIAGRARGGDDYYVIMFSAQRVPNDPDFSHSWATFVRVSCSDHGQCARIPIIEARTISWLP